MREWSTGILSIIPATPIPIHSLISTSKYSLHAKHWYTDAKQLKRILFEIRWCKIQDSIMFFLRKKVSIWGIRHFKAHPTILLTYPSIPPSLSPELYHEYSNVAYPYPCWYISHFIPTIFLSIRNFPSILQRTYTHRSRSTHDQYSSRRTKI